ncbi:hypothetical protein [Microbacterium sp. R86528]|uniref:hypothetical protein n=1 Tax=Microbacterium sp. R86528 TaxID=3093864 RepID=UPI0037CBD015
MSGELDIRGGGAVEVDTATLRETAARFIVASDELSRICARVGSLQNMLFAQRQYAGVALSTLALLTARLTDAAARGERIAADLRAAAAVYELVELNARHTVALWAGDDGAVSAIEKQRAALMAQHPEAMERARLAEFERAVLWPGDLVRQATEAGYDLGGLFDTARGADLLAAAVGGVAVGGTAIGFAALTGVGGWGRVQSDVTLNGSAQPVQVAASKQPSAAAPTSLTSAAERIPRTGASQVRVEKYTMADGTRQFAVYVSGTRTMAVSATEPWDSRSNVELYSGSRSASYDATESALRAAGARPGDVVHAFGHSQGAMITSHLALESEYSTRTLVNFGSPVEADVGSSTLSVGIRHTDDPVAALAGGGFMESVGAPGSFIAEREAHPLAGTDDLGIPSHQMTSYVETATMLDASADPRVNQLSEVFEELAHATTVEVTEFAATRAGSEGATASLGDEE